MARRWRWAAVGAAVLGTACATGLDGEETTNEDDAGPSASASTSTSSTGGTDATTQGPGPTTGTGASGGTTGAGGSTTATCGDGMQTGTEGCDDGNQSNDDSCPDDPANGGTCQPATCGDGFVWSTDGGTESCDDGNSNTSDDCPDGATGTCQPASCTDGFLHNTGSGAEETVDCGGACLACSPEGLIFSEIVITPTAGEFVEIHNPTPNAVPLDDVYIADYATYYLITTASGAPGQYDFRVGFPAGSVIAAGGHIVISTQSATQFQTTYGVPPDFDLDSADGVAPAMIGEIDNQHGISNSDEMLVMFTWDGTSDLVTDMDYVLWGNTDEAMDKSGVMVGASTYLAETAVGTQSPAIAHPLDMATARCIYTEGGEATGSNGYGGDDETSEDFANTWDVVTPTPGTFNNCPVIAVVHKDAGELVHLDRSTFDEVDFVSITSSVFVDGVVSMARHPTTGVVFAILQDAFLDERYLARLNTSTGAAKVVAVLTDKIASMDFDAAGTLYAVVGDGDATPDRIGTLHQDTGVFTLVVNSPHLDDGETMAFNPLDGDFYRFSGIFFDMFGIDPTVPSATQISVTGDFPGEPSGIFWDGGIGEFVVWDTGGDIFNVTSTGVITDTGIFSFYRVGGAVIQ